jgi:hypothetical protein
MEWNGIRATTNHYNNVTMANLYTQVVVAKGRSLFKVVSVAMAELKLHILSDMDLDTTSSHEGGDDSSVSGGDLDVVNTQRGPGELRYCNFGRD